MKLAIVSDLHIGIKKSSDVHLKIAHDFFHRKLFPYLKENDIRTIMVLGDVFDTRETINVKAMNFVYDLFSMPFNFIILTGNHDLYHNNNAAITSLKILSRFNNVELVNLARDYKIGDSSFFIVPWVQDMEEFKKSLELSQASICFGHFDIDGFSYTGNTISEKSINPKIFSKFDKVFSGHFHTRCSKIINNTEIVYVGCPYELTRADAGNAKGFHVYDTETNNYEFIENKLSPRHIQVKYPTILDEATLQNNFIDVFVDEADLKDDDKIKEYLKIYNSEKYLQAPTVKIIKTEDYLTEDLKIDDESKSIIELITEYVKLQENIDNKKDLTKLLNIVYEESSR